MRTGLTSALSKKALQRRSGPTPISRVRWKAKASEPGRGGGARDHMRPVAADVVLVLGDVGEMREIAEGAHDREGLVGAEAVEDRLELAPRGRLVVAVEADRGLADLLDERVGLLALLLAHGVAEDAAEQADVLAQRPVLVGVVVFEGELLGEGHEMDPVGRAKLHGGGGRRKQSKWRAMAHR